jgi:uncharacterized membrane protein YsdA (DUF1294 family)/cold shock CspA family protein
VAQEGTIVRWNDIKGFGFIRSSAVGQDVFVHIRDYRAQDGTAPREGLRVSFEHVHVGGKGPRALAVQPVAGTHASSGKPGAARRPAHAPSQRARQARHAPHSGAWLALPLMAAYGMALAWLVWKGPLPWWILPASFLLNLATFFAYWQDKHAAQQRRWRVREDALHLWSLAGGWGGAWFAHQVLRHKSVKASFRSAYWTTVAVHCAAASTIWWFSQAR